MHPVSLLFRDTYDMIHQYNKGYTMDAFDRKFVMEFFLETDSISTLNRVAVAAAGVAQEHSELVGSCSGALRKEFRENWSVQPVTKRIRPVCKLSTNFYEEAILNYTDKEYEEKFKMKRATVRKLVNYITENSRPGGTRVPLEKKLHIFIWLLTSGCSYSEVGTLFGLHKSSISYILHETASLLAELRFDLIKWPTIDEQHVTRIKVNSSLKFPNCVGFMDACRLKVGSKRNKKDEPDIVLLQAVCDESLKFIDIFVGNVGETRKSKVYRESPLSRQLKNFIDFENHILCDSNYKLKKNLMTPFSSSEVLTSEEMKYNEIHWKTRAYIGNAFGLLQTKFKKLKHIDLNKPEAINALVSAACVLHNFVLQHEPDRGSVKEEAVTYDEGVTIDTLIVKNASEKRQFLCNYINYLENPMVTE